MTKRLIGRIAQVMAVLALASTAHAIPFTITGGTATTSGLSVGTSVSVTPSAGLARTFDLSTAGQTTGPFNFLDVTVSGLGVAGGFINASLNFSDPTTTAANGVLGGFAVVLGFMSGGSLSVINDPSPIAFGNGGLFDVDFFGFTTSCMFCKTLTGKITARVTLLQLPGTGTVTPPPTQVPEPAMLSLLGAGLLAIAFLSRRKRV
jgi:hypothetical protein